MVKLDLEKWALTIEDLRKLSLESDSARTRERFLALYLIAQNSCATRVAPLIGRDPQTLMKWVHLFNKRGPDGMIYRRTGGRRPLAERL